MNRLAIVFLLFLFSCEQSNPRNALPGKVGPIGEVLVVIPEKHWDGEIVAALRSFAEEPYTLLPQAENTLDLTLLDPVEFGRFWKPHRNVVIIDIADRIDTQTPSLKIYKNKYANDQVYAEIKGKTTHGIAETIRENGEALINAINRAELKRIASLVRSYSNESLTSTIKEKYAISIDFPRDAQLVKAYENFVWVQREQTRMKGGNNHDVKQGFFIYSYPYHSDSVFSYNYLLEKRNKTLKKYVEGGPKGSYMTTEMQLPPRYEEVSFKSEFAAEMRGLWRMENDFMGGPFYSMTLYDKANERIVTVDGYAYAPYFNKREYIREVEGIIKTLYFVDPDKKTTPTAKK